MLSVYDNVLENLKAIPGLSAKKVEDLVAEICLDISVFSNEKYLASWAGMFPGNNESGSKKSGRTNYGNKQVKAVITEVAWAATRTKDTFTVHDIIDWQQDEARSRH